MAQRPCAESRTRRPDGGGAVDDDENRVADARLPRSPRTGFLRASGQYEYRLLTIPRSTSGNDARQMLTDEAEYGRWELARTRLYAGGERKVWLRRRIIRQVRATW